MNAPNYTTKFHIDGTIAFVSLVRGENKVTMDVADYESFINNGLVWKHKEKYPSSYVNGATAENIFSFILGDARNDPTVDVTFANGNHYDVRRSNIKVERWFEKQLMCEYGRADFVSSHLSSKQTNGKRRNPIYQVNDDVFIMFTPPRNYVILDKAALDVINENEREFGRKLTWFTTKQGYVATRHPISGNTVFMHRLVMKYDKPNTDGYTIDHINRIRNDNRLSNLRVASHREQCMNRKGVIPGTKYERKRLAQPLPSGITQEMMPKYVGYYTEEYNTKSGLRTREFFRVEKHPNQCGHEFNTSKSVKVSIAEKLEEAKRIVAQLDKREITNVAEVKPKQEAEPGYTMPPYFHLASQHGKPAVCFERRYDDGKRRVGIKVTIKEGETAQQVVQRIMEQVDVETGEKKTKQPKTSSDGCVLPKGFSIATEKSSGKEYLSFQRNVKGKRYVGRTFVGEGEAVADVLVRLKDTIRKRYELDGDDASVIA